MDRFATTKHFQKPKQYLSAFESDKIENGHLRWSNWSQKRLLRIGESIR